jgi:hypothetical protein
MCRVGIPCSTRSPVDVRRPERGTDLRVLKTTLTVVGDSSPAPVGPLRVCLHEADFDGSGGCSSASIDWISLQIRTVLHFPPGKRQQSTCNHFIFNDLRIAPACWSARRHRSSLHIAVWRRKRPPLRIRLDPALPGLRRKTCIEARPRPALGGESSGPAPEDRRIGLVREAAGRFYQPLVLKPLTSTVLGLTFRSLRKS